MLWQFCGMTNYSLLLMFLLITYERGLIKNEKSYLHVRFLWVEILLSNVLENFHGVVKNCKEKNTLIFFNIKHCTKTINLDII